MLIINKELCKGCGLCERACPKNILVLSKSYINRSGYHPVEVTDMAACVQCKSCALTCPDICIEITED